MNSPGNRFQSEKIAAGSNPLHHTRRERLIVLKCFDIFLHLRGSGMVDKIKKYRRDSPSGVFTDLGHWDLPQPTASVNPNGGGR